MDTAFVFDPKGNYQVVGKIRLEQAPAINHWWQVPLYVTARGLTTSPSPYRTRIFQIDFDFIRDFRRIANQFEFVTNDVEDTTALDAGGGYSGGSGLRAWRHPG
mgnify:CR=1 FL=1